MDQIRRLGSAGHFSNKRIGLSNIRGVEKSRSIPRLFSRFGYWWKSISRRIFLHKSNFCLIILYKLKDLKTESKIITQTNIIICTPGRLLQHMDETFNFSCDHLKILGLLFVKIKELRQFQLNE